MNIKEKTLKEIKENFDRDIKKKLNPLYDISQNVHKDIVNELKELFEAVGIFAFEAGSTETKNEYQKIINEKDKKIGELQLFIAGVNFSRRNKKLIKRICE